MSLRCTLVIMLTILSLHTAGNNESIRGLYQIASIPNHDCIANTVHQFSSNEDGFRMIVKAGRDIKAGEEITHSYVDAQEPFLVRQELLRLGKFFHCSCSRCRDKTELGEFISHTSNVTRHTLHVTRYTSHKILSTIVDVRELQQRPALPRLP